MWNSKPEEWHTNAVSTALDSLVRYALRGGLPKVIFLLGLAAGAIAMVYARREEEPQIVVPMVDVLVQAPGISAKQVERQVTTPWIVWWCSICKFFEYFEGFFEHGIFYGITDYQENKPLIIKDKNRLLIIEWE